MADSRNQGALYFLAIVPPEPVQRSVRALQEELHTAYGARHAMRSPPHITLQMPFRMQADQVGPLSALLAPRCLDFPGFDLNLDGFGCFPPRVIFLKVNPHDPVILLHNIIRELLARHTRLHPAAITQQVHPHMTLATRDLKKRDFEAAWPGYESRPFFGSFRADALTLLKHEGHVWVAHETYPFGPASMHVVS